MMALPGVTACKGYTGWQQTCWRRRESKACKLLDKGSSSVGRHHARGQEDVGQLQKAGPVLSSEHWRLHKHVS